MKSATALVFILLSSFSYLKGNRIQVSNNNVDNDTFKIVVYNPSVKDTLIGKCVGMINFENKENEFPIVKDFDFLLLSIVYRDSPSQIQFKYRLNSEISKDDARVLKFYTKELLKGMNQKDFRNWLKKKKLPYGSCRIIFQFTIIPSK
jgi:hypothetical protein